VPYRNWADTDTLNAADLNAMTADAVSGFIAANETTASITYGDLTTVGPSVTLTLVNGQGCLVFITATLSNDADLSTSAAAASFAVSGVESLVASDDYNIQKSRSDHATCTRCYWYVASITGSHTFTMKYKRINTGNANFSNRRIIVKKF
jgi:hypothetical protein